MNKRELIARVQRHMGAGASRSAARAAVNAVLESILHSAATDSKTHIARLGTFEYKQHSKRSGHGLPTTPPNSRNTRTQRLVFRPAKHLRARCTGAPGVTAP